MSKVLFLDRDGVINVEVEGTYILHPSKVNFYEGVIETIAKARQYFDYIMVVTNQRCIGKGLLTPEGLTAIHHHMDNIFEAAGGKIDHYFYAPSIHSDDENRKPNIGMAIQAKAHYPDIDFEQSTMIGNNMSDMEFGRKLGMHTVFLHTTKEKVAMPHPLIDQQFDSLASWITTL